MIKYYSQKLRNRLKTLIKILQKVKVFNPILFYCIK